MNYVNKSEEINVDQKTIFNLINNVDSYQNFLLEIGVKKHTECICMNSLFCGNNWSPKIKIEDLIQEVEREKRLIQKKFTSSILPLLWQSEKHFTSLSTVECLHLPTLP